MSARPVGPYTIEERLATGGMAEVYVAKREGPHGFFKRVALKRILPQYSRDPDFVDMFISEARLAARLEHPNIVQVFDFGESTGDLFLAMELVVGSNVNRLLRAVAAREEAVPLDVALHVASQTAHALAYAHRARFDDHSGVGIVHRDVSPANILLTHTGHVKLSDFGIARAAGADTRTDEGHVRGKLGYMSPEQVTGRDLDGRSDVFTLTTVIAEMLIAEPLFGAGADLDILLRIRDTNLRALEDSSRRIPADVMKLLRQGLTRDPQQRPKASEFAKAVDEVIRRRGFSRGPERLAKLLQRLSLVKGSVTISPPSIAPGARPTSLFETSGLSSDPPMTAGAPAIYRVKLDGGGVVGPMSFPRLVQLVTSGLIQRETPLAREGSDFSPAAVFTELSRFMTSPALQFRPEETTGATRLGRLNGATLLPQVHRITRDIETGVLHLADGQRRKKIYFVEGRPEFIASTDRQELLGEYLVASGLCLRMEVEMALALLPRYSGRLGDALVGLGILRPIELFRAISAQVRGRYLEAFRWRAGEWAFVPGARSHEETLPLGHDPLELIRDAVLEAHPEELKSALEPHANAVVSKVDSPPLPFASFRLPEKWRPVLEPTGTMTVRHLVALETGRGGLGEDEVNRALYFGLSCELLRAS